MIHTALAYMVIVIIENLKDILEIKRGTIGFLGFDPQGYV